MAPKYFQPFLAFVLVFFLQDVCESAHDNCTGNGACPLGHHSDCNSGVDLLFDISYFFANSRNLNGNVALVDAAIDVTDTSCFNNTRLQWLYSPDNSNWTVTFKHAAGAADAADVFSVCVNVTASNWFLNLTKIVPVPGWWAFRIQNADPVRPSCSLPAHNATFELIREPRVPIQHTPYFNQTYIFDVVSSLQMAQHTTTSTIPTSTTDGGGDGILAWIYSWISYWLGFGSG